MQKKISVRKVCIAGLLLLCLALSACGQKGNTGDAVVSQTVEKYRNMTYGEYKQNTKREAEFYHGTRFIEEIPDSAISIIYEGEYDEELAGAVLKDHAIPLRLQGELKNLINGIKEPMTVEKLVQVLSPEKSAEAVCETLKGSGTAYTVGDDYVQIQFDRDKDKVLDTMIEISLDGPEAASVSPENEAWLYTNLQ